MARIPNELTAKLFKAHWRQSLVLKAKEHEKKLEIHLQVEADEELKNEFKTQGEYYKAVENKTVYVRPTRVLFRTT